MRDYVQGVAGTSGSTASAADEIARLRPAAEGAISWEEFDAARPSSCPDHARHADREVTCSLMTTARRRTSTSSRYVVVAVPELSSTVGVAAALRELVGSARIRISSLVGVVVGPDGRATAVEPGNCPASRS